MSSKKLTLSNEGIDNLIREIRGQKVILDSDLARVYGVEARSLNQAVARNRKRFPTDFLFQLSVDEYENIRSQIVTAGVRESNSSQTVMSSRKHRGLRYRPYAFTEHGALQAANILRSQRAVQMSVFVIRAFVKMRGTLLGTRELAKKLAALERQLTGRLDSHEAAIVHVLQRVMDLIDPPPLSPQPPKPRIGFKP
jgi:ORF6N domain